MTIKTRNSWRQMLAFLIRDGWNLTAVQKIDAGGKPIHNVEDYRVEAEKRIISSLGV
jgi:hypothetical protein